MEQKRTPIFASHLALKARMVDFSGYVLPVQYTSILEEHRAVRTACGLFDVSHMGQIAVSGKDSVQFMQYIMTNEMDSFPVGKCRYSFLCYANGGTVDDVVVYRLKEDSYLMVVNASNRIKAFEWMKEQKGAYDVAIEDVSDNHALLAIQGPKAKEVLTSMGVNDLPEKRYSFKENVMINNIPCLISATGYTGEKGYEIYVDANKGEALFLAILNAGA